MLLLQQFQAFFYKNQRIVMNQNQITSNHNQIRTKKTFNTKKGKQNKQNELIQRKLIPNQKQSNMNIQQSYLNIHKVSKNSQKSLSVKNQKYSQRLNYIMKSKQNLLNSQSISLQKPQPLFNTQRQPLKQRLSFRNHNQSRCSQSRRSSISISDMKNTFKQQRISALSRRKQQIQSEQRKQNDENEKQIQSLKTQKEQLEDKVLEYQNKIIDLQADLQVMRDKNSLRIKSIQELQGQSRSKIQMQMQQRLHAIQEKYQDEIKNKQCQAQEIKLIYQQKLSKKCKQIQNLQKFYEQQVIIEYKLQIDELKAKLLYENHVQQVIKGKQLQIQQLKKNLLIKSNSQSENFNKIEKENQFNIDLIQTIIKKLNQFGSKDNQFMDLKQLQKKTHSQIQMFIGYTIQEIKQRLNSSKNQQQSFEQKLQKQQTQIIRLHQIVFTKTQQITKLQKRLTESQQSITQLQIQKKSLIQEMQSIPSHQKLQTIKSIYQLEIKQLETKIKLLEQKIKQKQSSSVDELLEKEKQIKLLHQNQAILLKSLCQREAQDKIKQNQVQEIKKNQEKQCNRLLAQNKILQAKAFTLKTELAKKQSEIIYLQNSIAFNTNSQTLLSNQHLIIKLDSQLSTLKQQLVKKNYQHQLTRQTDLITLNQYQQKIQQLSHQLNQKKLQLQSLHIQNRFKQKRLQNKALIQQEILKIENQLVKKQCLVKNLEQEVKRKDENLCRKDLEYKRLEEKLVDKERYHQEYVGKLNKQFEIREMQLQAQFKQLKSLYSQMAKQLNESQQKIKKANISHKQQIQMAKQEVNKSNIQHSKQLQTYSQQISKLKQQLTFKQSQITRIKQSHNQLQITHKNKYQQSTKKYQQFKYKYQQLYLQNQELKQKYQKAKQVVKKIQFKKQQQKHIVDNTYRFNKEIINHCQQLIAETNRKSIEKEARNSIKQPHMGEKREFRITTNDTAYYPHRKQSLGELSYQVRSQQIQMLRMQNNLKNRLNNQQNKLNKEMIQKQSQLTTKQKVNKFTQKTNQVLNMSQIKSKQLSAKQKYNFKDQYLFSKLSIKNNQNLDKISKI